MRFAGHEVDTRRLWCQFDRDEFISKFYTACNYSGKHFVEKLDSLVENALYQTTKRANLKYTFIESSCISYLMSHETFKTWKALVKKYGNLFSENNSNSMFEILDMMAENGVYVYTNNEYFVTVDINKIKW